MPCLPDLISQNGGSVKYTRSIGIAFRLPVRGVQSLNGGVGTVFWEPVCGWNCRSRQLVSVRNVALWDPLSSLYRRLSFFSGSLLIISYHKVAFQLFTSNSIRRIYNSPGTIASFFEGISVVLQPLSAQVELNGVSFRLIRSTCYPAIKRPVSIC